MIKLIKSWIISRRQAAASERFDDGFGWAMSQHYLHDVKLYVLQQYADNAEYVDEDDEFDAGIRRAVKMLQVRKPVGHRWSK